MGQTQEKTKVFFAVCSAVLKLEVVKGHTKWTLSEVSRESGITRSLIYYYFGKDKETVLLEAYKFIIEVFFGKVGDERERIPTRLKQIIRDLKLMPYLFVLYYLQKNADTDIGKMIRKAEAGTIKNIHRDYPNLSEEQVFEVYLKELGAVAFNLEESKVDELFKAYK